MIRFLSDHDMELYVRVLWTHFGRDDWHELGISACHTFDDLGVHVTASDRDVWLYCQSNDLLLITGNRNMEDRDSLEATIRQLNRRESLPVVTVGQPQMLLDFRYREECAYRIAEIVIDMANLRGTGRLVIP